MMKNKFTFVCFACLVFLLHAHNGFAQDEVQQWKRFEIVLSHAASGNPFTDVQLSAVFSNNDTSFTVDGFFDGNDTFRIRFMPQQIGAWKYVTKSNVKSLHNKKGSFECIPAKGNNHGMVKVSNLYNFSYADGKQYYPVGTTAYAWNHMGKALQSMTLEALKQSGFNKIRMCVFPKDYNLVKEEPELFPFLTTKTAGEPSKKTGITRVSILLFSKHLNSKLKRWTSSALKLT